MHGYGMSLGAVARAEASLCTAAAAATVAEMRATPRMKVMKSVEAACAAELNQRQRVGQRLERGSAVSVRGSRSRRARGRSRV